MKRAFFSLFLLLAGVASGAEREILVCVSPDAPAAIRTAAANLNDALPLQALRRCGAATGEAKMTDSAPLLDDRNFRQAAYNHLVMVGLPGGDPLLDKCMGHQAAVGQGKFYRLGYGTLEGDVGYVECDWNPFLFSGKVRTNDYTTVAIKITGSSEKGVLAALEAFRGGLLNGVVPAGDVRRKENTLLDLDPSAEVPPALPDAIFAGAFRATRAGWTQPDAKEYRAFLDTGGVEPVRVWRVKYLADKVLDDVSGEAWVNGLHRLAYGNSVMIATFASGAEANSVCAELAGQRGAKKQTLDGVPAVVFDQPIDEAFKKSYGKIFYAAIGNKVVASSLPEDATREILKAVP